MIYRRDISMSRELSIQKQLLTIMDSLVSSIVTEICQLDIFQSKCQNGNTETDIKLVSPFKCVIVKKSIKNR